MVPTAHPPRSQEEASLARWRPLVEACCSVSQADDPSVARSVRAARTGWIRRCSRRRRRRSPTPPSALAPLRRLSAICQHTCLATPCAAGRRLDPSVPMSWDDVVQSMALHWGVWGPHSLHTAEATGSKPVTPTSTNALPELRAGAGCRQIASKPLTVVALALKALPRFGILRDFLAC